MSTKPAILAALRAGAARNRLAGAGTPTRQYRNTDRGRYLGQAAPKHRNTQQGLRPGSLPFETGCPPINFACTPPAMPLLLYAHRKESTHE